MTAELSADNKIINGLWISPDGKPLSNLERLCIYSYCAHGHDFRLWTYGDLPNIPQDTAPGKLEVRDGNEILPADKIFRVQKSFANFADWFRWELMRQFGGWYADMDTVCLRPLDFDDEIVFCEEAEQWVSNNFIKFPKGHSIACAMADACADPLQIVPWDDKKRMRRKRRRRLMFWKNPHENQGWGESGGPMGFSLAARHFGIVQNAKPPWVSAFIAWNTSRYFVDDELHKIGVLQPMLEKCYVLHFANSAFVGNGYDKNGDYHPQSPLEILKRRHLPEFKES